MSALMRSFDWKGTSLGAPEHWSEVLRTYVRLMLASEQPMYLGWTSDLIALYNDAYRPILGTEKHPGALGARTADIFGHDGYPGLKPYFDAVLEGHSVAFDDILVPLSRHGYLEECYFDVSYSPVHDGDGIAGVFSTVNETTDRVLGARRTKLLGTLASDLLGLSSTQQVAAAVMLAIEQQPPDLPCAALYLRDDTGALRFMSAAGLNEPQLAEIQPFLDVDEARTSQPTVSIPPLYTGPWPEPVTQLALLPLMHPEQSRTLGVLAAGLNPRKRLDGAYLDFLHLLSSQVAAALQHALLTERLQRQQEELEARTRTLEGFASLTRDLALETDRYSLIRRAQELTLELLPGAYVVYYEPEENVWRLKVQTGSMGSPALQAVVDAGLAWEAPSMLTPWTTRQPLYQDVYAQGSDTPAEVVRHVGAVATLPLLLNDEPVGIFGVGLFHKRAWTTVDRAVLETVIRSLGQALDRAEQTRQLDEERASLSAFVAFTEQVGVHSDELDLARLAIEVLSTRFPGASAGYYQPESGLWKLRAWNDAVPPQLVEVVTKGLSVSETPMLAEVLAQKTVHFRDGWDAEFERVPHSHVYEAVAAGPLLVRSDVVGILSVGVPRMPRWTARDKAIVRAVTQGFQRALERADLLGQLKARQAQLEAANEELEAFTYSVSHDLRTPIRHISGFSAVLRKSLGSQLDEKSRRSLDMIEGAAGRMNTLIDAMLDLSRTSRLPLRVGWVDLGALVVRAQEEALPELSDRDVEWRVSPLPMVLGDHDTLLQVMLNLISNALKYSRHRDVALVEIWAEERDREWEVFVRDNGAGFDPRYQDKLFGVFQRLHRNDEFEGIGVGLANVKRVIQRHGGRVSARGALGAGATFSFTLPKTP